MKSGTAACSLSLSSEPPDLATQARPTTTCLTLILLSHCLARPSLDRCETASSSSPSPRRSSRRSRKIRSFPAFRSLRHIPTVSGPSFRRPLDRISPSRRLSDRNSAPCSERYRRQTSLCDHAALFFVRWPTRNSRVRLYPKIECFPSRRSAICMLRRNHNRKNAAKTNAAPKKKGTSLYFHLITPLKLV